MSLEQRMGSLRGPRSRGEGIESSMRSRKVKNLGFSMFSDESKIIE